MNSCDISSHFTCNAFLTCITVSVHCDTHALWTVTRPGATVARSVELCGRKQATVDRYPAGSKPRGRETENNQWAARTRPAVGGPEGI